MITAICFVFHKSIIMWIYEWRKLYHHIYLIKTGYFPSMINIYISFPSKEMQSMNNETHDVKQYVTILNEYWRNYWVCNDWYQKLPNWLFLRCLGPRMNNLPTLCHDLWRGIYLLGEFWSMIYTFETVELLNCYSRLIIGSKSLIYPVWTDFVLFNVLNAEHLPTLYSFQKPDLTCMTPFRSVECVECWAYANFVYKCNVVNATRGFIVLCCGLIPISFRIIHHNPQH